MVVWTDQVTSAVKSQYCIGIGWWGTRLVLNEGPAWCPKAIVACLICSASNAAYVLFYIHIRPMCFIFSLMCLFIAFLVDKSLCGT